MNEVRTGIIGLGNIGTTHAKNITAGLVPNMRLTAICDISRERREFAKKAFPEAEIFDRADKMFESGLIDAVIISVPHYDHPTLAIAAFSHGIHVMVEKPAGVYTKQVMEMNAAAEKSGKLFGIMYNQRTNPIYQKLRRIVRSGELGAIKRVLWVITDWYRSQYYHDSCTWRSTWKTEGGGTLINQNPHQLDLWQWIFGMPSRVMSHVSFGKYYNIEVEDDVTAFMEYDNGMTGVYITSTGEAPGINHLEISCDMGMITVENDKITFIKNEISEREFNKINTNVFGMPKSKPCEIHTEPQTEEQHALILQNFTNAILHGEPLLAPGYDGIHGLTVSNAIHYSAWTGDWAEIENFPHDDFYKILNEKIAASTVVKEERNITANTEGSY